MDIRLNNIPSVIEGKWWICPSEPETKLGSVTDDSRGVKPGSLFFALRGTHVDGHSFIRDAAHGGAQAVVAENGFIPKNDLHWIEKKEVPLVLVKNSLTAFHALARYYRLHATNLQHVVCVTGSNGKTSVKEMIAQIFEQKWPGRVLKTHGNTNNHFGVPRNLLRLTEETRAAVIEIGCNQPGEIKPLSYMVGPTLGVITNIGNAHLENFGTDTAIAYEKSELLAQLPAKGVAVVREEEPHKALLLEHCTAETVLSFGSNKKADFHLEYNGPALDGYQLSITEKQTQETLDVTWQVPGFYQAMNAAAAVTAATAAGIPLQETKGKLRECVLPSMRLEMEKTGKINWVNDAYNANPQSMRAGIECFLEITAQTPREESRVLVLGDMLELGAQSHQEHVRILEWCKTLPDCHVIAVGQVMSDAAHECGDIPCFPDTESASAYLRKHLKPNDWVFLKGSRQLHLEDLKATTVADCPLHSLPAIPAAFLF